MGAIRVPVISAQAAHCAVGAAVERAREDGNAVVAAVVDATGQLVALLRAPGAPFHSTGIAQDKAYTAASFKMSSAEAYDLVSVREPLRQGMVTRNRTAMFGGGIPVKIDGEIVGAIGVSGGSEAMDIDYAIAGLAAIGAEQYSTGSGTRA